MGTKSPLNIVEDALAYALGQAPELTGYGIHKGQAIDTLEVPSVVVACESLNLAIPQGLGNYVCNVSVGVFTQIDGTTPLATHRASAQIVMSVLDNVTSVRAGFAVAADATCYDSLMTSIDTGRGDRAFMTTLNYSVTICLSAT